MDKDDTGRVALHPLGGHHVQPLIDAIRKQQNGNRRRYGQNIARDAHEFVRISKTPHGRLNIGMQRFRKAPPGHRGVGTISP